MRTAIAVLGRRNAGKSSLINALVGFDLAIVSDIPGTTTDPVEKAVEINPLGPCLIIDTAGIDDEGELGQKRIQKTRQVLEAADIGLLVIGDGQWTNNEEEITAQLKSQHKPIIVVVNKTDLVEYDELANYLAAKQLDFVLTSTLNGTGINTLKELLRTQKEAGRLEEPGLLGDLLLPGDLVMLVIPIDTGAPKGRLILPQVQTIRDILDNNAAAMIVKEDDLSAKLAKLAGPPNLVIADSQVILKVSQQVPDFIPLTTFSILFSRFKGDLPALAAGARAIDTLQDGDTVLIAEACSHHAMSDDIGRVKIPRWMRDYTGKNLYFEISSGPVFPKDLKAFKLIVQCGGCTITRRSYINRLQHAAESSVPITNYGVAISYMQGVLNRSLSPFPEIAQNLHK